MELYDESKNKNYKDSKGIRKIRISFINDTIIILSLDKNLKEGIENIVKVLRNVIRLRKVVLV